MEIEICSETRTVLCTVAVCITACVLVLMIYHYNVKAYDLGYTQTELHQGQPVIVWTKP